MEATDVAGTSGGGMETFVLIQNPGTAPAVVDISFQTGAGEVPPAGLQGVSIDAGTRRTVKANDYVPDNYNELVLHQWTHIARECFHGSRLHCIQPA